MIRHIRFDFTCTLSFGGLEMQHGGRKMENSGKIAIEKTTFLVKNIILIHILPFNHTRKYLYIAFMAFKYLQKFFPR